MPRSHAQLEAIQSGDDRSVVAHLTRAALRCAVPFYWLGLRLDQSRKARRAQPLGRPTVSVGNVTAGGTGKTPFTIDLVRRLQYNGHRPAVLMRGYRPNHAETSERQGENDHSRPADEPEMLRAALGPDVPVEAAPSRLTGAQRVLTQHPNVTCFVLDDGFQHRQAQRDLDLVLIDATKPFGHGHLLPRGLLREPLSALRRADAVIVNRADQARPEKVGDIDTAVTRHHGRPPLAHVATRWNELRDEHDRAQSIETLRSLRVHGVCAIGNPGAFLDQLAQHADAVTGSTVFNDHHGYTPADVQRILDAAHAQHADAVVLTEKDWAKWCRATAAIVDAGHPPLPVLRPVLRLAFLDGEDALERLLNGRLPR